MICNFVWFNLPKQVKEKIVNVPKGWYKLVQELNIHLDYLKTTYPEHYSTIFTPKYKITWWGLVFRDLPKLCQFYRTLPPPVINQIIYKTGTAPTLQDFETAIGFPLINGVKIGDVITFDNVSYHIPDNAFNSNTDLLNIITVPNVITGESSFENCTSLTSTGSVGTAGNYCYQNCTSLTSTGSVGTAGAQCFSGCTSLTSTGNVVTAGDSCFSGCTSLTNIDFTVCDNIGTSVGDDNVFADIIGKTITVTAKTIHQTSNGGNLEGDLQYLADNNTVTFNWI
jgi:hypothetical protein